MAGLYRPATLWAVLDRAAKGPAQNEFEGQQVVGRDVRAIHRRREADVVPGSDDEWYGHRQGQERGQMAKLKIEVVSGEGLLYSDEVDVVEAPGIDGELGIRSGHARLVSILGVGELKVKKDGE